MTVTILRGDCRDVLATLADRSIQSCVTSPPYYGLRSYLPDGHEDKHREIGLEPTPDEYVAEMVAVFREVRRVLRDDGTLWLNIGDSYASSPPGNVRGVSEKSGLNGANSDKYRETLMAGHATKRDTSRLAGYKPKDLLGIPWLLAFALRADGWFLRSAIVWHKVNPMPESVRDRPTSSYEHVFLFSKSPKYYYDWAAIAEPTADADAEEDGETLQGVRRSAAPSGVLHPQKRGGGKRLQAVQQGASAGVAQNGNGPREVCGQQQDRCEQGENGSLFRISEGQGCDPSTASGTTREAEGSRGDADEAGMGGDQGERRASLPLLSPAHGEACNGSCDPPQQGRASCGVEHRSGVQELQQSQGNENPHASLRNARNVWSIATTPTKFAHFATMPPELAARCIKAGTSEKGACPHCGAPWGRVTERAPVEQTGVTPKQAQYRAQGLASSKSTIGRTKAWSADEGRVETLGWAPSCVCPSHQPVPCMVLDPFGGAGTTGLCADRLNRHATLIELNPEYRTLAAERITADAPLFGAVA